MEEKKTTESKLSTSIPHSASWSAEVKANCIQLCHPRAASCRAFPPQWTISLILWAEINPSSIQLFLSGVGHRCNTVLVYSRQEGSSHLSALIKVLTKQSSIALGGRKPEVTMQDIVY